MTAEEMLVKNNVFQTEDVNQQFNLDVTRDCYVKTQKDIVKSMQEYAKIKCKELLEIVAKRADEAHIGGWDLDREEVISAVDLDKFIV